MLSETVLRELKEERARHKAIIDAIDVLLFKGHEGVEAIPITPEPKVPEKPRYERVPVGPKKKHVAASETRTMREIIHEAMEPGEMYSPSQLAEVTGLTVSQVAPVLSLAIKEGTIERPAPGTYRLRMRRQGES